MHLSAGADYSDSLTGQLYESIIAAGGVAPAQNLNESSHGLDMIGTASYAVAKGLATEVDVERREQSFLGESFGENSYSGSLLYTTGLLGGNLNTAASVTDNTLDNSSQNTLGFRAPASITHAASTIG